MGFSHVCVGGTFDLPLHKGHKALLHEAFQVGRFVIIGLTTRKYLVYSRKRDLERIRPYSMRKGSLDAWLSLKGYSGRYKITPLHREYRRELLKTANLDYAQAIVVSTETHDNAAKLNDLREKKGYDAMDIVTIPIVLADDGSRISSERIRKGEIDGDGKLIK